MYYIINKTQNTFTTHKGNWPEEYLQDILKKGDKIIVISTYSNTIKVPVNDGESEYCWQEFKIPTEVIYNVYYDMLNNNF